MNMAFLICLMVAALLIAIAMQAEERQCRKSDMGYHCHHNPGECGEPDPLSLDE